MDVCKDGTPGAAKQVFLLGCFSFAGNIGDGTAVCREVTCDDRATSLAYSTRGSMHNTSVKFFQPDAQICAVNRFT